MTKEEASQQIEVFFRRVGLSPLLFEDKNFVKARLGESFLGFEYDASDGLLSCQALIYRFRREPREEILNAVFAEESSENDHGRIVFESRDFSLYLQRDVAEKIDDDLFFEQVNQLARASLKWNSEILGQVAEKTVGK